MEAKEGKRQLRAEAEVFVRSSSVVGWEACPQRDYYPLCLRPFGISNFTTSLRCPAWQKRSKYCFYVFMYGLVFSAEGRVSKQHFLLPQ